MVTDLLEETTNKRVQIRQSWARFMKVVAMDGLFDIIRRRSYVNMQGRFGTAVVLYERICTFHTISLADASSEKGFTMTCQNNLSSGENCWILMATKIDRETIESIIREAVANWPDDPKLQEEMFEIS